MESHNKSHECEVCNKRFTEKSNLTRHMKLHFPKEHACNECGKSFSTKPQLDLHLKQHQYPRIPMYRQGEARMRCTAAAKAVADDPKKEVDPTWLDPVKAEAAARKAGGEMWRGQLVMTFGQYTGQSFRWLLENDACWAAWILSEFIHQGEQNELMKWQKERLQEYVNNFPSVTCLVDRKLKDPPGVPLYVAVKTVVLNGVQLQKYRCRRGSNSLEGLHSHLVNAIPSNRCGIMPFQVYLIAFAVQWNARMESLRVDGGRGRQTSCVDAAKIQRMNRQAELLFGKEHVLEPNFAAPLPYPDGYSHPDEEELLGVEYAMCQSTAFTARHYYAQKAEEEQCRKEEEGKGESAAEESDEEEEDERRLDFEEPLLQPEPQPDCQPGPSNRCIQPKPATASCVPAAVAKAPVLLVLPAQPQAPSVRLLPSANPLFLPVLPPCPPTVKPVMPNKSSKPCGACKVPQCGGQRKKYTPSKDKVAGSSQKIFTFCPSTNMSTTPGFKGITYNSYEHFKTVVDQELEKRRTSL